MIHVGNDDYANLSREQLIARLSLLEEQQSQTHSTPNRSDPEQEYRTIIQASMDSFWKIDPEGRIQDCNEAACSILGYSRSEMLALSLRDIDALEDEAKTKEHVRQIIEQGHDRFETRHRRKDGTIIDVEVSAYSIPGPGGSLLFAFSRDVTANKAALKALRHSEERYRAVVEDQTDLICRFRPDGTFSFVNEAGSRHFNKISSELIGTRWQALPHPDDVPVLEATLQELTPDNPLQVLETRLITADGDVRCIQFANRAFFDEHGNLAEIQAVGRDITERKQAEIALRDAESFSQAILHAMSAQVAVLDKEGDIIVVNDAWCRFAAENAPETGGLPRNTGIGTNYLDICLTATGFSADGAREAAAGIQAVLDGQREVYEQEYPCHTSNVQRWFLMTVTPLKRGVGGVVVSHHDISAPRLLADKLLQSEARSRSIFRSAPLGIGMLVNRVFVEVNEAFTAMTGYGTEELLGNSARMLYPTDADFNYVGTEKYRQISETGIGKVETRFLTKDGRVIDVALSSTPIIQENLSLGVIFCAQDITATKQVEQQRRLREATQKAALVREVHHRIKNHLQGVLGLLNNTVSSHPELAGFLESVIAHIRSISHVYGLLGRHPDTRVRVCDLILSALEANAPAAEVFYSGPNKDMEAILSPDEAVPMALIINELITNATKHVNALKTKVAIEVTSEVSPDGARIAVRNKPARLPHAFHFTHDIGTGTGLQLLKALMPTSGATLSYHQADDIVTAELLLKSPVITCQPIAASTLAAQAPAASFSLFPR